ncbi:MAG: NAD-dependent epimerase/dehydratase family protein [Defluviitaleaceae bacterium]|nr:NAD-dependent epimerase/dehydratase family protein [Defluviitaleaceae bacterium]
MQDKILQQDLQSIMEGLTDNERGKLNGKTIFITGFAGSLGFMMVQFFAQYGKELGIKHIYALDNYIFGKPNWVQDLQNHPLFTIREGDVVYEDFSFAADADLIFHMASLASPVYYRLHPIETMDADVVGLRRLLDFYENKDIYNLLFYSTSEIYGDPYPTMVPTPETYWGNVNTAGPRACYDESKRYAETLCYNFYYAKGFPSTIIRPFNSYGPGLRTNDKRAPADFALNVLNGEPIVLYSDGKATRTFCYSTDMTIASLKCALYGKFDIFNAGNDLGEMTVYQLAQIYQKTAKDLFGYEGEIVMRKHMDKHYNTDNPQRRCPDLVKIKNALGYAPQVSVEKGVERYLQYLGRQLCQK